MSALRFVRTLGELMPRAMTTRAATILLHLRSRDDETDTSKALQCATGMSAPSVSRALDTLSDLGYVERIPRPRTGQCQLYVKLTNDGRRIAGEIEAAFEAALPPTPAQRGKVSA